MGREALIEYLKAYDIMKKTIQFIDEEGGQLIDEAIKHLQNEKIIYKDEYIKSTIKESYFKWIIDHCKEFSTEFNKEYKVKLDSNLLSIYNEILLSILNILPSINQPKEVKENLEDHFYYLLNL